MQKKILVQYLAFGSTERFEFTAPIPDGPFPSADLLEYVFRQCNHVDGTEWIADKKLRSMSVGDTVTFIEGENETVYLCEGCGWKTL